MVVLPQPAVPYKMIFGMQFALSARNIEELFWKSSFWPKTSPNSDGLTSSAKGLGTSVENKDVTKLFLSPYHQNNFLFS